MLRPYKGKGRDRRARASLRFCASVFITVGRITVLSDKANLIGQRAIGFCCGSCGPRNISKMTVPGAVRAFHVYAAERNFFTAMMISTMKIIITTVCVTRNAGAFGVGASALAAGTFWKICAISTNTLNHCASIAVIT